MNIILRKPSAWLPLAISLAALLLIFGYVALYGAAHQSTGGEHAPARLFQLLMVTQAVIVAFFAMKWLPRAPRQALAVLSLQVAAALVPIITIIVLESSFS
jgi:hypothetical protein